MKTKQSPSQARRNEVAKQKALKARALAAAQTALAVATAQTAAALRSSMKEENANYDSNSN